MATELSLMDLPDDILTKLVSLLPIPQILRISRTNKQLKESCKYALKHSCKTDLYLSSSIDEDNDNIFELQTINLSLQKIDDNAHIIKFLRSIWKNIDSLQSEENAISKILQTLQLSPCKLQNIEILHQPKHCCLEYLPYLHNLEWIHLPFMGKATWNHLIRHCTAIKGISFEITPKNDCCAYADNAAADDGVALIQAPNLWSLSLNICGECPTFRSNELINQMMECAHNLHYFRIETSNDLSLEYFDNASAIKLPSNLIGLNVNCNSLIQKVFDVSACKKLSYLDFEISFLTEDIEENIYREFHRKSSVLLLSFIENALLFSFSKYQIRIGIWLNFENGTGTVCEQEKLDSIAEFKSIMAESASYCQFCDDCSKEAVVYTNQRGILTDHWANELFSVLSVDVVHSYHATSVMMDAMADMTDYDGESESLLKYWQKMDDFEIIV